MIKLRARGNATGIDAEIVGLLSRIDGADGDAFAVFGSRETFQSRDRAAAVALLRTRAGGMVPDWGRDLPQVARIPDLADLDDGDIVAIGPSGRVDTLFRAGSPNNSLFVTEQCNSHCLMCSQPPRATDDIPVLLTRNVRAVRLMPTSTATLGITGGEPTLLGRHFPDLLYVSRAALPNTQIEILSNGRRLADRVFAAEVAAASDPQMLWSVPLYADDPARHDYIVQAYGAFDETLEGLYNLAWHGVRCEIRVVLHGESIGRLPALARFIQKNLPFVEQVAFMGLEVTGLARANLGVLWVEPPDYMPSLSAAVAYLTDLRVPVSLYNLPLCLIAPEMRSYARVSISDWKREYLPACQGCGARQACGGVFGTSSRQSTRIHPIAASSQTPVAS